MEEILLGAKRLSLLKQNMPLPKYQRFHYPQIAASQSRITGVYGARGVGKTTLLLQVLRNLPLQWENTLYISCDHPMLQGVSLFDLVDSFCKSGGECMVIDEIHEAEDFEAHLKSIYDFLNIRVYFSGSSAVRITNPDFARRYSMYHLPILSLREYLEISLSIQLEPVTLPELLADHEALAHRLIQALPNGKILKYFEEYLRVGAYPFYFEDTHKYVDRLGETINTALHSDLGKLFHIPPDKIATLKKLLHTISISKPLELSIDKLASLTGITKTTLYKYIDYLSRAELVRHISHEAKRFGAIRKADKLYLSNTNLFSALSVEKEKGTLRETFFASMAGVHHQLHYLDQGDFLVDEKYTMEIGGRTKGFGQVQDLDNAWVIADGLEIGSGRKVPLWLFGFLY